MVRPAQAETRAGPRPSAHGQPWLRASDLSGAAAGPGTRVPGARPRPLSSPPPGCLASTSRAPGAERGQQKTIAGSAHNLVWDQRPSRAEAAAPWTGRSRPLFRPAPEARTRARRATRTQCRSQRGEAWCGRGAGPWRGLFRKPKRGCGGSC